MPSDPDTLNTSPETIEDALLRQYPPAVPEPCNECPWRKKSVPGYLGPYNAERWLESAHAEAPIPCHKTIQEGGWGPKTRQCRGAAAFRANVCKSPRNRTIEAWPPDPEVFESNAAFVEHHERSGRDA